MDGMVNPGELSINAVIRNKPKMLTGLSQKGTVAGTEVLPSPVMDRQRYRRIESTSPMRVNLVERGKPVSFLSQKGREAVRPTHGGAGMGVGKSERRPGMGRIRVAT